MRAIVPRSNLINLRGSSMQPIIPPTIDRNDLAYWFPRLEATGVPVPRTAIVTTDLDLSLVFEAGDTPEGFRNFLAHLTLAADALGYPAFLRTGHTSGKHDWPRTCFLRNPEAL